MAALDDNAGMADRLFEEYEIVKKSDGIYLYFPELEKEIANRIIADIFS